VTRRVRERWWLWGALVGMAFLTFAAVIAPVVIVPLFNSPTRLADPRVVVPVLSLARANGIGAGEVWEIDASKQTTRMSANVSGLLGTERITLNDNLLNRASLPEIESVMAHEMGHYVLGHVVKSIFFAAGLILVTLYAAHRLQAGLITRFATRFGFTQLSDVASLPLAMLLVGVLSFVVTPVAAGYSRWQEHEADRFGLEITRNNHAAATAFVTLQQENLSIPRRGLLYKLWRADHPLLGERIDFCNSYRPWDEGKPGRYEQLFKK